MKTIIEMAREASNTPIDHHATPDLFGISQIERFAELVRADERNRTWTQEHWTEYERSIAAAEREACAKVAEELSATTYECTVACGGPAQTFMQRMPKDAHEIAKQIRARGQA